VVATWAKPDQEDDQEGAEEPEEVPEVAVLGPTNFSAAAPEFVPPSVGQKIMEDSIRSGRKKGRHKNKENDNEGSTGDASGLTITTVMISGIPTRHTSESFRQQLDSWGLMGTYNFFYMPADRENLGPGYAFINFVDPPFASLCQWLFQQYEFEGFATPFHIQGLENNIAYWNQFCNPEDVSDVPLVIPTPVPSQWALDGVHAMLNSKISPQIREQFHKTKLCVFHKKGKCALAESCPFAHNKEELQPIPDLAKTKLCYNYFRHKCNDSRCKFAHGYQELRATNNVYKTELCRWWSYGGCKAGNACRYAHGVEELRGTQMTDGMVTVEYGEYGGIPADFMNMGMMADPNGAFIQEFGVLSNMPEDAKNGQVMIGAPPPESADGSNEDGISEMAFSDVSALFGPSDPKIRRQQTAPPASSHIPELLPLEQDVEDGDIVLRVKGTFMEAVRLDAEPPTMAMRRSWSDGDLPQLCEVMAGMDDFDDDL
jgi:hypothetical protein